ncbi:MULTISPECIES: GntR family transcriptional regulator [unclassified Leucobacter]|uniref:GntR family transcriptional regulator n=1 Tax=unclassified Leucobacter TaxID=2621730 RepID=UPI00165DDF3F|nr:MULTISPECIES: GntR family transcriptional regulator [unclassified Leucobacter]MBC9927993.1 GntR family transcriptional regulator [Leucobacter sp. cx-169]
MTEQPDIALHRMSTAEVVADTLMRMIVSGALQAGEPLRESSLAGRLGISRNSLREGIRLLEQSRLVKYEIHRGSVVSTPSVSDLEDLYRTRLHIELAAAQCTADDEQLETISVAFEALQASVALQEAEPIVAADLNLHQAIVGLLRSKRISEFYAQLRKELVFYFTVLSYADEEFVNPEEPIVARHQEIYDAICGRQPDTAVKLMREHIMQNFERLKEILIANDEAVEAK